MTTAAALTQMSRHDLKDLRRGIFEELTRGDREGEPEIIGSMVVESRPHADGLLLLEHRTFTPKTGGPTRTRGPYWTFRYQDEGKRKSIYIGKTDDPERALKEKRSRRR